MDLIINELKIWRINGFDDKYLKGSPALRFARTSAFKIGMKLFSNIWIIRCICPQLLVIGNQNH